MTYTVSDGFAFLTLVLLVFVETGEGGSTSDEFVADLAFVTRQVVVAAVLLIDLTVVLS